MLVVARLLKIKVILPIAMLIVIYEERLEEQISSVWHIQRARYNKFQFHSNQIIIMIANEIAPRANVLDANLETRLNSGRDH